jgi:hypothetical protein
MCSPGIILANNKVKNGVMIIPPPIPKRPAKNPVQLPKASKANTIYKDMMMRVVKDKLILQPNEASAAATPKEIGFVKNGSDRVVVGVIGSVNETSNLGHLFK